MTKSKWMLPVKESERARDEGIPLSTMLRALMDDDAPDKASDDADDTVDAPIVETPRPAITLTAGQEQAKAEILETMAKVNMFRGAEHVLMGFAGTGKTTLSEELIRAMIAAGKRVVATAPTNKAVSVIENKLRAAGIEIPCMTIYSLLGLTPGSDDAKRKPKRVGKNKSVRYDTVLIDECSMLGIDIMDWIKRDLRNHFVLYMGDPAQLPPVGEVLSQSFSVDRKSMLTQVMRQGADNPILALATDIRAMIDRALPDFERFHESDTGGETGIYCPNDAAMAWVEDAFTSPEFEANNDTYRYLCWTNARVQFVNSHIRRLIYGDTPTPFVKDERVLVRSNITSEESEEVVINTNDEATIHHIEAGIYTHAFDAHEAGATKDGRAYDALPARRIDLDVWKVVLRTRAGDLVETRIARDPAEYKQICDSLTAEATRNRTRWHEYFDFVDRVAKLQSVYAMTVHCSQGSTFGNVFLDMSDCTRNSRTVEMLKLLYVGTTRPQKALVLV